MLRVLFHILILPAMLWLERRSVSRFSPARSALIWYALGVPLAIVEAGASGREWLTILVQDVVVMLFFLPPAYLGFRYARSHSGIWRPFLLYLALSLLSGAVVAIVLARAPVALGLIR